MDWRSWEFQSINWQLRKSISDELCLLCKIRICLSPSLLRNNSASEKALPTCRPLVCKIDINESILFRYKVIFMKKGEKSQSLCFAASQQIIRFVTICIKSHGSLFVVLSFHDFWCRYRASSFRIWKKCEVGWPLFSCLWSENNIVQLLTPGQQCQVLSFLLLSVYNRYRFLLDCNEFLVEMPKWSKHTSLVFAS